MSVIFEEYGTRKLISINIVNTCSVVGNSGCLIKRPFPKEIDESDYVIRCNNAPVMNYSHLVGNKETIRIVNHISIKLINHRHLINTQYLFIFLPKHLRNNTDINRMIRNLKSKSKKCKFIMLTNEQVNKFYEIYENITGIKKQDGIWVSTGFIAFILGSILSNKVKLFGFGSPTLKDTNCPAHYYGNSKPQLLYLNHPNHKFYLEWLGLVKFKQNNNDNIDFFY